MAYKKGENKKEKSSKRTEPAEASTDSDTPDSSTLRRSPISRSERAGLTLPIGRIHKMLKKGNYANRIGAGAPVYLAGVLEYLVSEVTDLASQAAKDNNKKRITPRHLTMAIQRDEELKKLLSDVTIAQGGVMPNIRPELLPKCSKTNKRESPCETINVLGDTTNDSIELTQNKKVKKKSEDMQIDDYDNEE